MSGFSALGDKRRLESVKWNGLHLFYEVILVILLGRSICTYTMREVISVFIACSAD